MESLGSQGDAKQQKEHNWDPFNSEKQTPTLKANLASPEKVQVLYLGHRCQVLCVHKSE